MDPVTLSLIGAGIGGLGSYFGANAQADATAEAAKIQAEQLAFQKQQYADQLASKKAAGGVISTGYDTTGYSGKLNYTNPYQTGMDTSINAMLSGGLTAAELTQQAKDIATATQSTNAGAATMGLPAGARAALLNQNSATITGNYANKAGDRVGQGVQLATSAAGTGANIANMNYTADLNAFLKQQELQNQKTQLQASYA